MQLNFEEEQLPLQTFTERSYLEYSMYVILDRALPHIGDGLKPVQRRIIYAMSELGLSATAKYKKSARTVGDVLGKFHPHGDTACYEAMVLMAQSFSYRYPLVDGQGNWGSPDDPKSFAAMRYTESRLSPYAKNLLEELTQGTIEWGVNFDGSLKEPKVLPARLPNLLLNGTTGIAVGMATDIPPHNLSEVIQACNYLLDHPNASTEKLFQFIKGPDFPTKAELITPQEELLKIYQTGSGSLRMRATHTIENEEIIIHAIPYQTSGTKILEQIANQMQSKKITLIKDLRDESDHENPTRFVIVPKSKQVNYSALLSHLYATTDLERTYRVNMNVIGLNGKPQVKSLHLFLSEWLQFRTQTVRNRLEFRLDKIKTRLHLLEGLLLTFLNLDQVIQIIREEDHPKSILMKKIGLSEKQAESVLEIKLRQLAKLEEIKLKKEENELKQEQKEIQEIISSEKKMKSLISKELKQDTKIYGNQRLSKIIEREPAHVFQKKDLVSQESITVILSRQGWIRVAKGHDIQPSKLNYKSGDQFLKSIQGKSNQTVVFMDSTGRGYSIEAHQLPSARGQGEPLTSWLDFPQGATCKDFYIGEDQLFLVAQNKGYGFLIKDTDIQTKNKAGKKIISVPTSAELFPLIPIQDIENDVLIAISNIGKILTFPVHQMPRLQKGKGNQIMSFASKTTENSEYILCLNILSKNQGIKIYSGRKKITLSSEDLKQYHSERGKKGKKLSNELNQITKVTIY